MTWCEWMMFWLSSRSIADVAIGDGAADDEKGENRREP